jgi:hypothetical protein
VADSLDLPRETTVFKAGDPDSHCTGNAPNMYVYTVAKGGRILVM